MSEGVTCPRCDRPLARPEERAPRCQYCGWDGAQRAPQRSEARSRSRGVTGTLARGLSSLVGTLVRIALIVAVLSLVAVPLGGTGVPVLDSIAGDAYDTLEELSASVADRNPDPASASPDGAERERNESAGAVSGSASTSANASASDSNSAIDRAATERYIHQYINEERTERGLEPLEFDTELREVARYYSDRMAREGFFAHTAPDGDTLADRYDRFEYDCRVAIDDGRVATGGENLAYTFYDAPVRTDSGMEVYDSERELARGIVDGWMNSTGHRENLLRPYWEGEGIGVYATEEEGRLRVYATQHFC
ncbi:CAP domain-containing protein [Halobacteriales archaeon QS_3_64_16]|nr:MAG: CAP domain-containing protein [Halobacteriales archaeon QS_3_64_16]